MKSKETHIEIKLAFCIVVIIASILVWAIFAVDNKATKQYQQGNTLIRVTNTESSYDSTVYKWNAVIQQYEIKYEIHKKK